MALLTYLKIGGGILLALALAALWVRGNTYKAQRDDLAAWQTEVTQAARDAAHRPKLGKKHVAQQVRYLGQDIDKIRTQMAEAKAKALADKLAQEERDRQRKRKADDAYILARNEDRRRTDDYVRSHIVRGKSDPPAVDRGNYRIGDMPEPALSAEGADRSGDDAELVAISRADLDICTVNSRRLQIGHDWAVKAD